VWRVQWALTPMVPHRMRSRGLTRHSPDAAERQRTHKGQGLVGTQVERSQSIEAHIGGCEHYVESAPHRCRGGLYERHHDRYQLPRQAPAQRAAMRAARAARLEPWLANLATAGNWLATTGNWLAELWRFSVSDVVHYSSATAIV
jgi:hypothetical protein